MIKINHPNKEELAKEFAERIMTSAGKRKAGRKLKELIPNKNKSDKRSLKDQESLFERLKPIILSIYLVKEELKTEADIKEFIDGKIVEIKKEIKNIGIKEEDIKEEDVQKVFLDYDDLIKCESGGIKHGTWLKQQLNLLVCPYCNHNYIASRGSTKDDQLDHFYPKEGAKVYKWLALSFYNLIPSCPNCNQLKLDQQIDHSPYIQGFERVPIFRMEKLIEYLMGEPDLEINLNAEALGKNMEVFKLKELYAQHTAEAEELIFKARAYQEDYYESLIESFGGMGLDEGEMHRMIFGNYPDPEDFSKRPLAKFTYDLLQQLGVKPPKQSTLTAL